ncbi:hypothetical protein [Streptomyces griseoaurantiacus]|uniref:hypothetical protein n=1 Tax=Streptomyces griseoaurantiacus TaxID=68213 RepID=UPI002F90AD9C
MNTSPQSETVGVVLAVEPDRFTEVVEALQRAGLTVTSEQPNLGTLSGTVVKNRIPVLEAIDGVASIDEERTIRLPPPDATAV